MPDQASQPVEPTSLPAPYVNPWGALGQNVVAVLADCRLRVQELWRRNGEGDFWRPQVWPRDLAPLFWPVVSGVVVVALAAISVALGGVLTHNSPRADLPRGALESSQGVVEATEPNADSMAMVAPPASFPQASAAERADAVDQESLVSEAEMITESSSDAPDILELPQSEPHALPSPDPLLIELQDQTRAIRSVSAPSDLLLALEVPSARNARVLTLGEGWARETALIHQQLADLWWQTLEAQGYDELILRSQTGVVVGRSARVGKGMVINES